MVPAILKRQHGKRLLSALIFAGLFFGGAASAFAQAYPSRPTKIIVPFAVGGPADVYGRLVAQRLQEVLGQPFIVENRPGGGAVIGTDAAAKSAPDGYTLLLMSNTHTVNESLMKNKPYELTRDFDGIAPINYSDLVFVVKSGLPAKNMADLIRDAKAKPDGMTYASSGPGTPYHMAGELFKFTIGASIVHVPYKNSSGARTDVLGGQVDMMFDAIPTMAEQIKAGKVRAFAVTGAKRSDVIPDVPTMGEVGIKEFDAGIWLGLMAPKGTPADIVNRLNAEVRKMVSDPAVRANWAKQGASSMAMSPAEFNDFIKADVSRWARLVNATKMKLE
jgi:tripartite-type tricarboxylate transporter receptor subunit TctC